MEHKASESAADHRKFKGDDQENKQCFVTTDKSWDSLKEVSKWSKLGDGQTAPVFLWSFWHTNDLVPETPAERMCVNHHKTTFMSMSYTRMVLWIIQIQSSEWMQQFMWDWTESKTILT